MIAIVSKDVKFDKSLMPKARMFNEYYGGSMSSIVFQEIRESKGLAYGCYAGYSQASEPEKSNYVFGYLSTQPDKMKEALDALTGLLNELALSEESFVNSKDAIIKQINTERIIKDNIYWNYLYYDKLGIDYDIRKDIYDGVKTFTLNDVSEFFDNHIAGKKYDILIIGNRDKINFNLLKSYGQVHELTLEELFGY
jgi:predicted Zn-dependent peptidase